MMFGTMRENTVHSQLSSDDLTKLNPEQRRFALYDFFEVKRPSRKPRHLFVRGFGGRYERARDFLD